MQIDNIVGQAVVSGQAAPGSVVLVALNGQTLSARADAEGLWSVAFSGDRLPPDNTYQASVVTLAPDGQISESQSNAAVIDFAGPEVQVLAGAASVDDIENAADYVDGITLRGTGEPFVEIEVTIAGEVERTLSAADGTWQVTFAQDQFPPGEYNQTITLTATDALGRVTILVDQLEVDTVPPAVALSEPDALVSLAAAAQGVRLAGTAEPVVQVRVEAEGGAVALAQPRREKTDR
ncbi:phage tail protein [Rhodobacter maris]|uniref:Bacterial Ig-like domain-containing protein n=1 Tax=Rhodobacter maris TaxID=446682 RepID=A0A285TIG9_9RHOB|nr:hypothetical protein [Rhodobacter maris]SOC21804.1 hypothetical protein SAMN05877831_1259 [Rhodobacter maris]